MQKFGELDLFFAKRLLKEAFTEERGEFLSTLMQVSRQGNLCWKTLDAPEMPTAIIGGPVIKDGDRYYLQRNWAYETHILEQVERLKTLAPAPIHDEAIFYEELKKAPVNAAQGQAISSSFQSAFSLICGGPGTGKTYTAGFLVRLLSASAKKSYKVILAAPTGKAASHLQTILGGQYPAMTLHRLLGLSSGKSPLFQIKKIDADLVIIDEASMIDVPLLAQLLKSIGDETRLVLMGDPDQLPPVEAGSLFAEMAALFGSRLHESKRTGLAHLQELAQLINQGKWDLKGRLDWAFDSHLPQKLYEAVNPVISWDQPDPQSCLRELNRFRILGALRQGPFGVDTLNQQIVQEMGRRIKPGQWWVVPIMVTNNEPRLELYNGTCGVLIGKGRGGINFRDGTAFFPEKVAYHSLPLFEPAFCLSVHKSQGSEFDRVLALFPQGSENFGREALYTAVTRAKTGVDLMGESEIFLSMLTRTSRKISGFTDRFKHGNN